MLVADSWPSGKVQLYFKMVPEHNVLNVLTYATIGSCHNGNLSTQVLSI